MGSGWIFSPPDRVITAEAQRRGKEGEMKRKEGNWEVVSVMLLVFERITFKTQTSEATDKNENAELCTKGIM